MNSSTHLFAHWLVSAVAVMITAYVLPGAHVGSFFVAFVVAVVLGIINVFLKPILIILTLPINIVSLGLFTFVINALLVQLASNLVPGFQVDGFLWALAFSVMLSVVHSFLHSVSRQ